MASSKSTPEKLTGHESIHLHDDSTNLNLMYRFSHEIYSRKIFRKFDGKSFLPFRILGILIGNIQAQNYYHKLDQVWTILHPKFKNQHKTHRKWTRRLMAYIIEFFLEITFFLPNITPKNVDKFIKISGEHHLLSALKQNRGVIAPSIHLGAFFHLFGRLRYQTIDGKEDGEPIKISAIGTPQNEFLIRRQIQNFPAIYPIITGPAIDLKKTISTHLQANHLVILMQDFCKPHQLRVPFIYGIENYNFLIPTPQMLTSQHILHGSPIIPILTIPGKDLRFSHVKIFPEINPMKVDLQKEKSEKIRQEILKFRRQELTAKQSRGLISLLVNRRVNPYILKYPFYWEEIFPFRSRNRRRVEFTQNKNGNLIIRQICQEGIDFLKNSYEPGRNDEKLIILFQKIESISVSTSDSWQIPDGLLPKSYDFGFKSGKKVIIQLIEFMRKCMLCLNDISKEQIVSMLTNIEALLS